MLFIKLNILGCLSKKRMTDGDKRMMFASNPRSVEESPSKSNLFRYSPSALTEDLWTGQDYRDTNQALINTWNPGI